ncbi:MAG: mutator MutT protein [uncultured bacterium]|nr:MAG: mutator MutT protein [uncultured bacterium]KKU26150.1 MAG: 7,8-dihydro-8-oxoguanine-triphosphatase-like protein [Microgenomates group bacterium GW2011_GWA2_46_16]
MTTTKHQNQQIIVAALGLPISSDRQQVLLTQRHAPGNPAWHHKWQLAGGSVDFGETMEEAVLREMQEELHVQSTIIHSYPIVKTSIWYANESDEKMNTQVILIAYLVDISDQVPDLSHDPDWETSAYGWYTLNEAKKLDCLPLTIPIVEEAFQLIAQHEIIK